MHSLYFFVPIAPSYGLIATTSWSALFLIFRSDQKRNHDTRSFLRITQIIDLNLLCIA